MIINFIFRFLNFSFLIGLFYFFIKRSVLPAIIKMMADQDFFLYTLKNDTEKLHDDCRLISNKTDVQEQQFATIEMKFLQWQKKCRDQKNARIVDQQKIEQAIHYRFDIRSENVTNELAIKEQLPYILDRVTQQLQEKYHNVEPQQKYIEELIQVMKEQS